MDNLSQVPATANYTKAGFVAGTTSTVTTTVTAMYTIRGKIYTKTAITNGATPTTDLNTGIAFVGILANYGAVIVWGLDSSGAQKAVQGPVTPLDATGAFILAPQFPVIPDTMCPLGYLVIKAGSTANATTGFIFGSSNLSGVTGITYTFVDIGTLPDRPQIA